MAETKRTKNIAFRLTDDEYTQIEKAATAAGDDPNTWCRKLALTQSTEGHMFTKNERLIYQEIAILRFLIGHGFKLLFSRNETTAATWKQLTTQADQKSDQIVSELLSRRGV
ncbi:MAG: plasmid mobilization protein [Halobacteriota archaeon]